MVDAEVPLHHKLFQVAKAKPKPEIPANAQDDDLSFQMPSFECCWPGSPHARASLANRRRRLCNTSADSPGESISRHSKKDFCTRTRRYAQQPQCTFGRP